MEKENELAYKEEIENQRETIEYYQQSINNERLINRAKEEVYEKIIKMLIR